MENEKNNLNFKQKLAASGLAIFAIVLVVVWGISMRQNIHGFLDSEIVSDVSNDIESSTVSEDEELKTKDTDGDNLSDWDELNIYGTSPYLEDSDSDGYSDDSEVTSGYNPNCPQGTNCDTLNFLIKEDTSDEESDFLSGLNETESSVLDALTNSQDITGIDSKQVGEDSLLDALSGESSASELRQLLLDSGVSKEILDQISDEVLLDSYKQTLDQ